MTWKPAETAPTGAPVQVATADGATTGARFSDGSWIIISTHWFYSSSPYAETRHARDASILGWTELPDPPPAKVTE